MIDTIKTTWKNSALGKLIVLFLAFLVLSPLSCCMCAIPMGLLAPNTPTPVANSIQEIVGERPETIQRGGSTIPSHATTTYASKTPETTIIAAEASPSTTPTDVVPTATFTPLPPTATPTPVPLVASKNANLRAGPGTAFPKVGTVTAGDELEIIGQTEDGSWYKLATGAWIAAFLVKGVQSNPPVVQDIPTPPPTPTPKPTKPTGKPDVRIVGMLRDGVKGRNEPDEYVEIANLGNAPQDMTGWMLVSERRGNDRGQIFYFPRGFILQPGQHCRVYTNEYHPEYCGLSFNHRGAVWNNSKPDAALLVDNHGNVVSVWQ